MSSPMSEIVIDIRIKSNMAPCVLNETHEVTRPASSLSHPLLLLPLPQPFRNPAHLTVRRISEEDKFKKMKRNTRRILTFRERIEEKKNGRRKMMRRRRKRRLKSASTPLQMLLEG